MRIWIHENALLLIFQGFLSKKWFLAWLPLQSLAAKKKNNFLCTFWAVKNF